MPPPENVISEKRLTPLHLLHLKICICQHINIYLCDAGNIYNYRTSEVNSLWEPSPNVHSSCTEGARIFPFQSLNWALSVRSAVSNN